MNNEQEKSVESLILNGQPFNPADHFIKIKAKDGTMREYLPYAARLAWFRARRPKGKIDPNIVEHDREAGFILFEVVIDDMEGGYAKAYGSCTRAAFPGGHIEKAETKAKGRALADLGYGTLAAQELEEWAEENGFADAPLERTNGRQQDSKAEQQPEENVSLDSVPSAAALRKEIESLKPKDKTGKVMNWASCLASCAKEDIEAHRTTVQQLVTAADELDPYYCRKVAGFIATVKKVRAKKGDAA